jgi:spore maturation protein SpmA
MNLAFALIVVLAAMVAAFSGTMEQVTQAALSAAGASVTLAIGLVGTMALFLGLMQVAQEAGVLRALARALRPIMVRLFPDVPPDHPAMSAMIMNIGANMLGLGNAATPFGIKAMVELDTLNRHKGVATNAMVLFLAINTSSVGLLPTKVIAIRAEAGSGDAIGIVAPTLVATLASTFIAVLVAKLLQRWSVFSLPPEAEAEALAEGDTASEDMTPVSRWAVWALSMGLAGTVAILAVPAIWATVLEASDPGRAQLIAFTSSVSHWVIPLLLASIVGAAAWRRVKVYEAFVEGAREGFETGVRIIPYLVAILVAIGMFRASGAMEVMTSLLGIVTEPAGLPAEVVPMALVRPLSGSGALAMVAELNATHGPDSYIGYLSSVLNGSTETTFYVLAVYFGAVGISRARHAVAAGLTADLAGVIAAVIVCQAFFGHLA